jgi:hypothetical protein
MSGLGGLDRPGAPEGVGAWDDRSRRWAAGPEEGAGLGEGDGETAVADRRGSSPDTGVNARPGADRPAAEVPTSRRPAPTRRTAADPVKALMHRHRELCRRAVDPLEIAAGLEAHGVTDRTAARFRHRDVFSLAEEMFARSTRDEEPPASPTALDVPPAGTGWVLLTLLPGVLGTATVAVLRLTHGQARLAVAAVGVLAVALGLRAALARGPLATPGRTPPGATAHAAGAWTCWLLAYALLGDGLLSAAVTGGPDGLPTGGADGPWPIATAPVLALAWSCAPAAWSARLFAVRARRRLAASRGLEEFAASVRPLLLGTFALYLCALSALLAACCAALDEPAYSGQGLALGSLLLLARLLTVPGFPHAPAFALTAAATAEAAALATVFTGRLPGCGFLATPVETMADAWGVGSVPVLVCAAAALALLLRATRTLTRASAHAPHGEPW